MVLASILSFIVSAFVSFLIVRFSPHFFYDPVKAGTQKFHKRPTPRAGGLGIFLGVVFAGVVLFFKGAPFIKTYWFFVFSAFPAFLGGLLEDITKKISVKKRFLFMLLSAFIAVFLLDAVVVRVDIPFIDMLFGIYPFSFIFTVFAIAGLTNAINIIDGFNGLASGISITIFFAIAYVAYLNNDFFILAVSLIMIAGILGFFIFNYPSGLIFLGDGGAYFLGFTIAVLSILLVKKHPEVSAWFPIAVAVYPIYETLFSIYRRKFIRKVSPTAPDRFHLHTLFYKTIVKKLLGTSNPVYRNPATSPLIWSINMIGVIPAVLFWDNTLVLILSVLLFIFVYTKVYFSIIRSKLPKSKKFNSI
ncbi:UDP-N-acetylmuramyl pentapeptide phosphotransferase/UDP-N-acetylglucosamine-1-phosphate transferase [Persephonella hydrogeniphila]|uniref:UDP-N-acetylmuramyl pentapeptide phosphotransferase/UDP-N-acetylglucosamine-1-phosphate transferase n=1 Tax=Persephonella hydrogeniphila TaxID=198703 RepID=A0A285N9I1_9AQUI|nr:glycosyltransferase [Persephonella hydrogeniphila]SNZ06142.1 UDP-N-acetylmuramyl pentapeptide phosphotransferase/UDP-N-acetylglucosamine-1-phosphate transferase [Persephonella hydrogeniphila]